MFILRLLNFLSGYYIVTVKNRSPEAVINILMRSRLNFWGLKRVTSDEILFCILKKHYKSFKHLMTESKIIDFSTEERGAPKFFAKYRVRFGIPVGALLFFAIVWLSGFFIWDIDVVGNQNVKSEDILERLELLGCGVGSFLPSVDLDELCNRYILENDDLSWISVNMEGTVARVEVRERIRRPDIISDTAPSNIVARIGGQIDYYSVHSGMPAKRVGDSVKEGELLISGVIDSKALGYRLVRASGSVYAKTTRSLSVSVPLVHTYKSYTGEEVNKKTVGILGKKIKLYINDEIYLENYDRIVDMNRIIIAGFRMPIIVTTEIYKGFTTEKALYTEEQAMAVAEAKMAKLLESELAGAELLSITVSSSFDGETYLITCEVYCLEDIGREVKINTGP